MFELLDKNDKVINQETLDKVYANKKYDGWSGAAKYVSAYDLHKALGLSNTDSIPNDILLCYLYDLGVDTERNAVIEQETWHRPLSAPTNSPIKATRWVGKERTDKAWLESGSASKEVRISQANFRDLGAELDRLGKQSNFTAEILDHMREKRDVSKKKDGKVTGYGGHA